MDILSDEHEREEIVQKWWHEHWKPITLGIVIALAGLVGVRQYQAYSLKQDQQTAYEVYQIQSQLGTRGVAALEDGDKFLESHKDVYGALLALDMANVNLAAKNFTAAQKYVQFAKDNGGKLIEPQTALILARLEAQAGNYDKALSTVGSVKSKAYAAEANEVKGDILMAKGDQKGAHDAYGAAIKSLKDNKLQISPVLQMKFDNVIESGDTPAYKLVAEQAKDAATQLGAN